MYSNGTSTRTASRLALPTCCTSLAMVVGVRRLVEHQRERGQRGVLRQEGAVLPGQREADGLQVVDVEVARHGRAVSALTSVQTPHDGPLEAMLMSRLAASGEKAAGKFATTSTRYGSATSPAARL